MAPQDRLGSHVLVLSLLADDSDSTRETRRAVLLTCRAELIKIIGETALNVLNGNLPLTHHYKTKVQKYAAVIRQLGSREVKAPARRALCHKNPNAVSAMLKPVLQDLIAVLKA